MHIMKWFNIIYSIVFSDFGGEEMIKSTYVHIYIHHLLPANGVSIGAYICMGNTSFANYTA